MNVLRYFSRVATVNSIRWALPDFGANFCLCGWSASLHAVVECQRCFSLPCVRAGAFFFGVRNFKPFSQHVTFDRALSSSFFCHVLALLVSDDSFLSFMCSSSLFFPLLPLGSELPSLLLSFLLLPGGMWLSRTADWQYEGKNYVLFSTSVNCVLRHAASLLTSANPAEMVGGGVNVCRCCCWVQKWALASPHCHVSPPLPHPLPLFSFFLLHFIPIMIPLPASSVWRDQ